MISRNSVRCSSLLLVFLVCSCWEIAKATASCRDEYLITVANTSLGIDVAVLHKDRTSDKPYQQPGTIAVTVGDHYLSPECGSHYSRCKELLVVETKYTGQRIVLVPILNGILLLELRYNGWEMSLTDYQTIEIAFGCSPTAIFKILNSIFTICLNLQTRYLTLLEIDLNIASIKDTEITSPLLLFNELHDPPELSNFVLADLDTDAESQLIYFSTAGYMYTIVPFSYLYSDSGKLAFCTQADSIARADQWTLIAYCNDDTTVYYDMFYNDWINQTEYTERGKTYVCPNNPDVHLAVYPASYIQYGLWSQNSLENFNIPGMKFDSGACFGAKNNSLFVYNDKDAGVYVLETSSSTLIQLSPKPCPDSHCEPLMVFDNRYVVIREKDTFDASVTVVDSQQNYSKIINGLHTQADLLTLIVEEPLSPLACNSSYKPVSTPTVKSPPSLSEDVIWPTIVGTSSGVLLVLTFGIVTSVAVMVMCYNKGKHHWPVDVEGGRLPIQEEAAHQSAEAMQEEGHGDLKPVDVERGRLPIQEEAHNHGEGYEELRKAYALKPTNEELVIDRRVVAATAQAQREISPDFVQVPKPNHVYPEQNKTQAAQPTAKAIQEERHGDLKNEDDVSSSDDPPHTITAIESAPPAHTTKPAQETSTLTGHGLQPNDKSLDSMCLSMPESPATMQVRMFTNTIPQQEDNSNSSSASSISSQGHEGGDEEAAYPETESHSDRESKSDDQLINGKESAIPKKKGLHATRHKMKRRRSARRSCDYENLEMQIVQDEVNKN